MYNNMKRSSFIMCLDVSVSLFCKSLCEWNSLNECIVLKLIVSIIKSQNVKFLRDRAIRGISTASHCLKRCVGLFPMSQDLYQGYNIQTPYSNGRYQLDLEGGTMTASHCLKRCVELCLPSRTIYTIYTKPSSVYLLYYVPQGYNTYIVQCRKLRMSRPAPTYTGNAPFISMLNNNE